MSTHCIRELLDEIDTLTQECQDGARAWEQGEDSFAMAACDPSDQYEKGEQISKLWKQIAAISAEQGN